MPAVYYVSLDGCVSLLHHNTGCWYYTSGKNFLQKFTGCRDEPIKSTVTRQGWKQKTTLIGKDGGKEGQEHYPTSVAWCIVCMHDTFQCMTRLIVLIVYA